MTAPQAWLVLGACLLLYAAMLGVPARVLAPVAYVLAWVSGIGLVAEVIEAVSDVSGKNGGT